QQQVGPHQGHRPGGLREPLVPADADPDPAVPGVPHAEPGVAGGEVELLLVPRPVGDVGLAVHPADVAVVDQGHRVEVHRGGVLEERHRHHRPGAGGDLLHGPHGRVGVHGGGPAEVVLVLGLWEVPALEQLGAQHDVGAGGDGLSRGAGGGGAVRRPVVAESSLDDRQRHHHPDSSGAGGPPFARCGRYPRVMAGSTLASTPAAEGFAMPAEWESHDGCYLVWPERTDTWRFGGKPAQVAFAAVAAAIAETEAVTVLVSARQWGHARAVLPPAVRVVEATTDDAWARDTGPTFVVDAARTERRGVDWVFNAWGGLDGGLLFPWDHDDQVAAKVCEVERVGRYRAPLVLEGGSVHVDGDGTCLTTAECLLNRNRNPGLSPDDIEGHLRGYLGVDKVVW